MAMFLVRRLAGAIPLLLFVSVSVFALLQAAPGGPSGAYMRRGTMNAEDIARIEQQLGLNDPLPVQYGKWLGRVLKGVPEVSRSVPAGVVSHAVDADPASPAPLRPGAEFFYKEFLPAERPVPAATPAAPSGIPAPAPPAGQEPPKPPAAMRPVPSAY